MTVTDQIKIIGNKIKANQAQHDLDRLTAKISALSSGELREYEYLTGEDLGYRPSVLEQTKFDYSPLGKVFSKESNDKHDKKEGLLKRLKNIEKNQNVNNNDKSKETNDKSELNSVKSKSSKKTSIRDDELERSVYFRDVANMVGIDILGSKDETQTSYLKDDLKDVFLGYPDIFDSDLKSFFENIASQGKENINYKLLSREIRKSSKKTFSFLQKHGNLYDFLNNVLENKSLDNIKLLQVGLLDDLMNGFSVYKKVKGANSATDLYLYLPGNWRKTVYGIFLDTPTDKYHK